MSDGKASQREEGTELLPRFNADGLVTAMVVDAKSREPLMLAHMNAQALDLTLSTGEAHFFSRSRGEIWHKGATSGNVLTVKDIRIDCDQDALWLEVEIAGHGAACHTGRRSCFYRQVATKDGVASLKVMDDIRAFDPKKVYGE